MSKKTTLYVSTEETIVRRRQVVVQVEQSYVQLYKNIRAYTLAMAPGSPVDLMLFLITKMNENNGMHINREVKTEFIKSLPKPITERSFYRLVKLLIKSNVLIPVTRGEYKMNPAIVWQGDVGTRMEHIRFLEQGGVKLKPNEKLILDKKEENDGKVTINGDEAKAQEVLQGMVEGEAPAPVATDYGDMDLAGAQDYIESQRNKEQNEENSDTDFKWDLPLDFGTAESAFE